MFLFVLFVKMFFNQDSPFWFNKMKESEGRIRRLSLRLNELCDLVLDFCDICMKFSEECTNIYNAVKKSWEDVENEYAMDILSLNAQFTELGEQFLHMASASKQLSVTMKAVLVDAFRDFTEHHLAQVSASSKTLKHLGHEYESSLRKLLHTPKNLPEINPKKKQGTSRGRWMCMFMPRLFCFVLYIFALFCVFVCLFVCFLPTESPLFG